MYKILIFDFVWQREDAKTWTGLTINISRDGGEHIAGVSCWSSEVFIMDVLYWILKPQNPSANSFQNAYLVIQYEALAGKRFFCVQNVDNHSATHAWDYYFEWPSESRWTTPVNWEHDTSHRMV